MDKTNSYECDIVQDLLPLYHDDVCSSSSKTLVEQHIVNCEKCKKTYEELKNHMIENIITEESSSVLQRHAKKEKSAAYKAGLIIAALLLLPIIITLIVSMANGGGLGIFLVVLASMLFIGAMTVVPLMSVTKKFAKTIICAVIALLFIILFVDRLNGGGGFLFIAIPTIFGISIVFFPFVIRAITLPLVLSDKKALITICWDTVWLYLTIYVICIRDNSMQELRTGIIVATIFMLLIWIVFFICRYLSKNWWIKIGTSTIFCGIWTAFANDLSILFIEHKKQLLILSSDFSNWSSNVCINANICTISLLVGLIIGIILILIGTIKIQKVKKH